MAGRMDKAALGAWSRGPVGRGVVVLFWLAVAAMLWANLARQSTDYGTNYGRFADQVDSFSEYLIRNSVIDRVRLDRPDPGYLIYTPGFKAGDYAYRSGPTERYYSNRGVQAVAFAWLGSLAPRFFLDHHAQVFQALRFLNALALAGCILVFFIAWLGRNRLSLILALTMSLSGGVCLFASNLYFMAWVMFTPLLCFPLVKRERYGVYCLAAFLLSLANFSMRYEFATTFALLWIFPLLVKALNGSAMRWGYAGIAFLASCAGFGVALTLHHISVAGAIHGSPEQASRLIFVTLETRVASFANVPAPLTPGFFWALLKRWSWTGFAIPLLASVSKLFVLIAFAWLWRRYRAWRGIALLATWAVASYLSWYVFSYQHIMLHLMYDSLILACSVQLVTVMMAGLALRQWLDGTTISDPLESPAAKADVGDR